MQADSFSPKREGRDVIHVNIVLYASSQGGIWSHVELIVWSLSIPDKQSTARQATTGCGVPFMLNDYPPQIQSYTHVFFKETVSHNTAVQLMCVGEA